VIPIPDPAELKAAAESAEYATEWEVAFHEAGPVVVEVVVAWSYPTSAYITDDPSLNHRGRVTSPAFFRAWLPYVFSPREESFARRIQQERLDLAAVLLGGCLAAWLAKDDDPYPGDAAWPLFNDGPHDADTDMGKVRKLVDLHGFDDDWEDWEDLAGEWVEEAATVALDALKSNWSQVRRVAAALMEKRTLDSSALSDLVPEDEVQRR